MTRTPARPEVLRLHAEGLTNVAIAARVGCSRERVRKILLTEGLSQNRRAVPSDAECVALYNEGLTYTDIGGQLAMDKESIRYRCKRAGLQSRPAGPAPILSPSEVERMLSLARQGTRQADIAEEFEVSKEMVSRLCRKHGIRRRAFRGRS